MLCTRRGCHTFSPYCNFATSGFSARKLNNFRFMTCGIGTIKATKSAISATKRTKTCRACQQASRRPSLDNRSSVVVPLVLVVGNVLEGRYLPSCSRESWWWLGRGFTARARGFCGVGTVEGVLGRLTRWDLVQSKVDRKGKVLEAS